MQTPKPRVSIGLPVYNGERYLREALNSILSQTYTDFELIISDNASVDETQKICMGFAEKDRRIRYYRNETNLGAAPNHNLVFKLAKGEYFRWAGCDDRISPELLEKCVSFLDNHLDIVLCIPNTGIIGEYGEDLGGFEYGKDIGLPTPRDRFRFFSLKNTSGNYVYGLIRSNAIAKTALLGSYPSSDLAFLAELSLYGKFGVVPECLFFRRIHPAKSTEGMLANERNRVAFFDTSNIGKILLPKWQMLANYLRAIRRSEIDWSAKLVCNFYMAIWIVQLRNLRPLVKDIILAMQKAILMIPSKIL